MAKNICCYVKKKSDNIPHLLKASFKVLQKYDYRPPFFNESKSYTRNALEVGQQYQSKCCTFNSLKIKTNDLKWPASIPGRQLASCHFRHVYFLIKAFRILNKNTSVLNC